jgi:hypothetical protein
MSKHRVAFILALIAGTLCLGKFIYTYYQSTELDYTILLAGIFIVGLGISNYKKQ